MKKGRGVISCPLVLYKQEFSKTSRLPDLGGKKHIKIKVIGYNMVCECFDAD